MAPRHTVSSDLGVREANGQFPLTKRSIPADVLGLVSGMNLMTGPAGPAFCPVNVQVVKVQIPISKIGKRACPLVSEQGIFVAFETEPISCLFKFNIELFGIILVQDFV